MYSFIQIYSNKLGEISRFLSNYYSSILVTYNTLKWEKTFKNPLDIIELMSTLIDNQEDYIINVWISLDKNILINVNEFNLDKIIRYLYERYPY